MVVLQSQQLLLRIDPQHGGEVVDLIDLTSGRQLMGRPPFGTKEPIAGDLDEATWIETYRGGWQLLTPNAGNACEVDGILYGYHGRASNDPWTVHSATDRNVLLAWSGQNVEVLRDFRLRDDALEVVVHITATADRVPIVAVEHIAFGIELLDPSVCIDLPAARACEMDELASYRKLQQLDKIYWPSIRLADGTVEQGAYWPLKSRRSRMVSLTDFSNGWAALRNQSRGFGIALAWDAEWLRHMWIWHEARMTGGPWREQTEMLILEPASTPHYFGLAQSLTDGCGTWLAAGESREYRVLLRTFADTRAVIHADLAGQITFDADR